MAGRAAVASGALGVGGGPEGRGGDGGYSGGPQVRRLRPRVDSGVPARVGVRGTLDCRGGGYHHRRLRQPVGGDDPRPGSRSGAGAADRRPLRDRPGQSHHRPSFAADRGRRVHRPLRLHHRPEPRIRRSGRADRTADAAERGGQNRFRQLAGRWGGRAAGRMHRLQRGGRGGLGGPRHDPGPVRGGGRAGPGRQGIRTGWRLVPAWVSRPLRERLEGVAPSPDAAG